MATNRKEIYQKFQEAFPIEYLNEMPLEKYTNLNRDDSFCYWVESKTEGLGSFWGGSSFKFGIYKYNQTPSNDSRIQYDDNYAWYSKYNQATAQEAYDIVRNAVVKIANFARNGIFESIDSIDELGDSYKWKIAFLYSNESLLPIYSRELLNEVSSKLGLDNPNSKPVSEIQRFLISKKGVKDLYDFYDELLVIIREYNKKKKEEAKKNKTQTAVGPKSWIYNPGENAFMWGDCIQEKLMCIGWESLGNLNQYNTIGDVQKKLQEVYQKPESSFANDRLAIWEFCHVIKPGDIIYAKKGISTIIGRGVVTGDYIYDPIRPNHPHYRKVNWTNIGEWDIPSISLPIKTLTDYSKHKVLKTIENVFSTSNILPSITQSVTQTNKQYWWLVANPKMWSISGMKNGEVQDYTLYNDSGHPRRIFQNFTNAKKGDIVIGYEATPTKQVVAILEIEKENDGKNIWFKKIETLGTPIDYSELKSIEELKDMEFFNNFQGSLFKLTEDEYNVIMEYVREANPIVTTAKQKYSKADFLNDVFIKESDFDTLKSLVLRKKNVILQGAPGVGKTFAAKRLAYAIMGEIDDNRIEQIQFHQNYSYEDFMMGYKPNETGGFYMKTGSFYNFCKRAAADDQNTPYFFIIDEINRGNLSKIFGELLMLIENDYRDKPIKLSYRDEKFSVPSNVHIIGMMNTADRSLAMIDYALRRRFSFFEMNPGFDTAGFKNYISSLANKQLNKVIEAVVDLNKTISEDDSLGNGFCIGHSYFCNLTTVTSNLLTDIVVYDIIPMLREYWFDNDDKFKQEAQKLKDALV